MSMVFLLYFLSGFSALIYELLWFRRLGFVFGNTVHAATTVLTAYMAGLALGAWLLGRWGRRVTRPVRLFGLLELSIGVCALCVPFLLEGVRGLYRLSYLHLSDSLAVLTPLRFLGASVILLVPTMCMGGTLPILSESLLSGWSDFGKRLGWLYGANTLGAVAGVIGSGFFLLPALGLTGTNRVAVAGNFIVGSLALLIERFPRRTANPAPEPLAVAISPPRRTRGSCFCQWGYRDS